MAHDNASVVDSSASRISDEMITKRQNGESQINLQAQKYHEAFVRWTRKEHCIVNRVNF